MKSSVSVKYIDKYNVSLIIQTFKLYADAIYLQQHSKLKEFYLLTKYDEYSIDLFLNMKTDNIDDIFAAKFNRFSIDGKPDMFSIKLETKPIDCRNYNFRKGKFYLSGDNTIFSIRYEIEGNISKIKPIGMSTQKRDEMLNFYDYYNHRAYKTNTPKLSVGTRYGNGGVYGNAYNSYYSVNYPYGGGRFTPN